MSKVTERGGSMPRISMTGMPQQCSSCAGQYPDRRYVDFEAECDRGFYGDGKSHIVMDDLIICDECIKDAATKLGMEDKEIRQNEINKLHSANKKLGMERDHAVKETKGLRRLVQEYYEKEPILG